MRIISALAITVISTPQIHAFVTPTTLQTTPRTIIQPTVVLKDVVTEENAEEKIIDDDIPIVESTSVDTSATTSTTTSTNTKSITKERLDKLQKERPYPLFIAEKTASFLFDTNPTKSLPIINSPPKEKFVVLGTGWGSAAFLKNIDTNKFDVTVISPRNYFVFTPMLAGSAVGTVDFKSITEPVREVCCVLCLVLCCVSFVYLFVHIICTNSLYVVLYSSLRFVFSYIYLNSSQNTTDQQQGTIPGSSRNRN